MVGGCKLVLEDILTIKEIEEILKRSIGENVSCVFKSSEVKPAMDGIAGFLGDHIKAVLRVDVDGEVKEVNLFLKRIPKNNEPKAEFIYKNNYFKREQFMYQLVEEICEEDENPWSIKAYIHTDTMVVLPDLKPQKYQPQHLHNTFDFQHVLVTVNSIARFHAAFVNYETKKSIELNSPYNIIEEVNNLFVEPVFCDSPWLRSCSKLSTNLLKNFSTKSYFNISDLEFKLTKLYLEACDSFVEYKNTINSLIHRDLWVNNIMFKYENNVPINAILIDYQCIKYGPPAFDLMAFLYFTTSRKFRGEHEEKTLDYYYAIFSKNLTKKSKERLQNLGYDKNNFLKWCEKARMLGIFTAIGMYPYILMDSKNAQATFDDPETYDKYLFGCEDRSDPVIAYCLKCEPYKQRNLEVTEEFIERYLLKQL